MKSQTSWLLSLVDDPSLKIQIFKYVGVSRGEIHVGQFRSDILFKIVFNDLLITRSRRSERSHHHYGEIVEDIIDHDLKENITSKLADMYLTTANSNIFGSSAMGHMIIY